MKAKNTLLLSIGAVFLAASFAIAGVFYFKLKNVSEGNSIVVEEETAQPVDNTETTIADQSVPGPNDFPENFEMQDLTRSLGKEKIVVDWYKGAKPATAEEYQKIIYAHDPWMKEINDRKENNCLEPVPEEQPQNRPPCPVYLYQAGVIKSPEMFQGQIIYLMLSGLGEMGFGYSEFYTIYNEKTGKLISLVQDDNSGDIFTDSFYKLGRFVSSYIKTSSVFLKYPQIIEPTKQDFLLRWNSPSGRSSVTIQVNGTQFNQGGIYDAAKSGINSIYDEKDKVLISKNGTPIYFIDDNFQIQLTDGAVHLYSLIPSFFHASGELSAEKEYFPSSFIVDITWTNGNDKKDEYVLGGDMKLFCGMFIDTKTNVVNKKDWFSEKKLVEIGKTNKGEKVYELSDKKTNTYYKQFFDYGYEGSVAVGDEEISEAEKYSKFTADTPIFFWQDNFGNWRVYLKSKYRAVAECGKPVIYLYPEKEMDVKVKVQPNGGFTKTEPIYDNGWFVRATPQSELFNYANKTNYPYLFWEGHAYGFSSPDNGFVMSKAEVGVKMTQILGKLGLNEKETKDFLEFWQPKLEAKPYVFVTFVSQREFDKAAPLSVNPKPDTIIRVFMDYTLLDAPIKVAPMQIKTPERKGFTVVEWGGRLH
ncbi:MAG: hypothetical protein HZC26_03440 [Candidatus Magasanikbacteria bacterium]|nr:hypothetical protein [Candidatus Magasanikbacteria bacterium]